jgi:alanine dehydrogenase
MSPPQTLEIVSDSAARAVARIDTAITLIEDMFAELARGTCEICPVVQGRGPDENSRFGVKCGSLRRGTVLGCKVGSYWPGNVSRGLESHGSTTMLLHSDTGLPRALIAASYINSLRTAAADGVAIKLLARPQAYSVGLIGSGHQAWFELMAARCVRPVREVRVWNRDQRRANALVARVLSELEIAARVTSAEEASGCDIVITVTASTTPIVRREWVQPGAHISAMGADGAGKQELDVGLVAAGRLFADVISQSISLGEFERAFRDGTIRPENINTLGDVIEKRVTGRENDQQITIFDSSGIALQDLAIAQATLEAARKAGLLQTVAF